MRRIRFIIPLLLLSLIMVVALTTCVSRNQTNSKTTKPVKQIIHDVHYSYVVKPGDTFSSIMDQLGIPRIHAHNYYTSLKEVGFSTLFPGDSVSVTRDPRKHRIQSLSLLNRLCTNFSLKHLTDTTVLARKELIRTTTYTCVVKGTLNTSLSEDLSLLGVGDAIAAQLADIFGWDINFFVDPQPGDKFEILYEKIYRDGRFENFGRIISARYENQGKSFYAIAHPDSSGKFFYYDISGKTVRKQFLKAPLSFRRISSTFSLKRIHPVLGIARPHLGIDYAAPTGTPVYASASGTIAFAGWKGGYGNHIVISHNGGYKTLYGHLQRIAKGVRNGSHVAQGDLIGFVGSTGLSSGPHLDYRMQQGNRFINPLKLNIPSAERIPPPEENRFANEKSASLFLLHSRFPVAGNYTVDITVPDNSADIIETKNILPQLANGR